MGIIKKNVKENHIPSHGLKFEKKYCGSPLGTPIAMKIVQNEHTMKKPCDLTIVFNLEL
jgi:hypothetical protein